MTGIDALFVLSFEGIKGTVRRNQDGHFIHANIDLDIIITEEVNGSGFQEKILGSLGDISKWTVVSEETELYTFHLSSTLTFFSCLA